MLLVANNDPFSTTTSPGSNSRFGADCPPPVFPVSEGDFSPPSPDTDMGSCPLLTLCTGGGARHRHENKNNKKHLRFSFFRRGRNFLRKGDSSEKEVERKKSEVIENANVRSLECQESKTNDSNTSGSMCQCRKCSLISLGDVDTREVHTMIKFIKQNKVQRNTSNTHKHLWNLWSPWETFCLDLIFCPPKFKVWDMREDDNYT